MFTNLMTDMINQFPFGSFNSFYLYNNFLAGKKPEIISNTPNIRAAEYYLYYKDRDSTLIKIYLIEGYNNINFVKDTKLDLYFRSNILNLHKVLVHIYLPYPSYYNKIFLTEVEKILRDFDQSRFNKTQLIYINAYVVDTIVSLYRIGFDSIKLQGDNLISFSEEFKLFKKNLKYFNTTKPNDFKTQAQGYIKDCRFFLFTDQSFYTINKAVHEFKSKLANDPSILKCNKPYYNYNIPEVTKPKFYNSDIFYVTVFLCCFSVGLYAYNR